MSCVTKKNRVLREAKSVESASQKRKRRKIKITTHLAILIAIYLFVAMMSEEQCHEGVAHHPAVSMTHSESHFPVSKPPPQDMDSEAGRCAVPHASVPHRKQNVSRFMSSPTGMSRYNHGDVSLEENYIFERECCGMQCKCNVSPCIECATSVCPCACMLAFSLQGAARGCCVTGPRFIRKHSTCWAWCCALSCNACRVEWYNHTFCRIISCIFCCTQEG